MAKQEVMAAVGSEFVLKNGTRVVAAKATDHCKGCHFVAEWGATCTVCNDDGDYELVGPCEPTNRSIVPGESIIFKKATEEDK